GVQDIYDQYKQTKDLSKVNYNQATLRAATTAVIAGLLNSGLSFSKFSLSSSALLGAKLAWLRPNLFANLMTLTRAERTQLADALQNVSDDVLTRLENPTFFADFSKAILVSGSTPSSGILSSVSRVQSWVNSWLGIKDKALKWVRSTTLTGTLGIMTLTGTPQVEARIIDNSGIIETVMRVPNVASDLINGNSSEISSIVSQASVVAEVNASQILDQTGEALSSSSGTYEILQSTINSVQNILVRLKTSSTISTQPIVLIKDGKTYKIGDDSKCVYCGKTVLKPASGEDNTEYTLCQDLNTLEARGGTNGNAGVSKLCSAFPTVASLRPIVTRLLQITNNSEISTILSDITQEDNSYAVTHYMNNFDSNIIDAWQLLNLYNQPFRRRNNPLLQKVKVLQDDNSFVSKIGGVNGLAEIVAKNSRAPYKGCTNCNATYLRDIDEYLDDVKHFSTFSGVAGGYSTALNLLKSTTTIRKLEPEAFIIRVLKSENLSVMGFEVAKTGCEPDLVLADNTLCEFKSWKTTLTGNADEDNVEEEDYDFGNTLPSYTTSKTPFENFVSGHTGVKQFIAYLSLPEVSDMGKLRYYFDARKGATEPYAKSAFKQMLYDGTNLTANGTAAFNAIFGNLTLRTTLFDLSATATKTPQEQFKDIVSNTGNSFYQFIKAK
ncbi:hypothetical protein, partial [Cellulophaga sp. BC115SP]|uniref:hypothetical protein n=1 Tax=Cellulophaga sp. BC115SP TaxID=2683263 RepID=UPI001412C72C